MQSFENALLGRMQGLLGVPDKLVALHEPEFGAEEHALVKDTLDSTFVSSVGKYVDQFESELALFTGARYAVAVANGTAALQVALKLAGVQAGDEVLLPSLTFVASANAVTHAGAVPHFVDSEVCTLGVDALALGEHLASVAELTSQGLRNKATGRRIAAMVPMHAYGHPVDLAGLMDVAGRYGIPIVEDAAESLGSYYQGRHTGTFGKLGTLSFNGNKIITTGGGGAIITDDAEVARHAKHLTTTAKVAHRWEFFHDEVAWNFRLPNLNAALGVAQLHRLPQFLEEKRRLAAAYERVLAGLDGVAFAHEPEGTRSNYWLATMRLLTPDLAQRDRLLATLNDAKFQSRPTWTLLHKLPMYAACPRASLQVAEALEASLINLPSSPKLARTL
ncbi:MAG: aminotransferase DegT [Ideonella sp. MAG2]|nr:MAG: aminotransferase DegT [Ideonella sp. MAG2]